MKPLFFIIFILLTSFAASAQVHMNVTSANLNRDTTRMKPRVHAGIGVLQTGELNSFNYDEFIRQRDSRANAELYARQHDTLLLQTRLDDFKKRLISIDSLLANSSTSWIDDPLLKFKITYWENGTIDSFAITFTDDDIFSESENFDRLVQELKLTQLQFTLDHAQHVNRWQTQTWQPIQLDVRQTLSNLQAQAGFSSGLSYPDVLLNFIHSLLRNNKDKLGITSETTYEDSFEPADLTANQKVAMREKFITYVYSKL